MSPILDFTGAKNDGGGGDSWSYDMQSKAPVKQSPPTNQHTASYRLDAIPVNSPTNSVRAQRDKISHSMDLLTQCSLGVFQPCL